METKELFKIIDENKTEDASNKKADKLLILKWNVFKNIKGKTMGDVKRNTRKKLGVEPSFLSLAYRDDTDGATKYIQAKYQ